MPVRVDSDHIRLFRDIVLHRSISKGAALNSMSQSAASQHLQELERRVGAMLLDRSTRPFTITELGQRYLELCQDVLRRCEEFDTEAERIRNEVSGVLRIAAIYSVGLSTMGEVEAAFSERFPAASLEVSYLQPSRVYLSIMNEVCDLGLISYPENSRELKVLPWLDETMVLAVSPRHPFAAHQSIDPKALEGVSFIAFDSDLPIRQHIDRFLAERQIHVRQSMSFDNIPMIKEALVLGRGVSILPLRMMAAEIQEGKLMGVPINAEGLVRPIGLVHLRRRPLSKVAEHFYTLLKEEFGEDTFSRLMIQDTAPAESEMLTG